MDQYYLFNQPSGIINTCEFPNLTGVKEIGLDTETTGLHLYDDRAVGVSIATKDASWYFPWGHAQGPNLEKEKVIEYLNDTLKDGITAFSVNAIYDNEMLLHEGVDLEANGVRLREVQHGAALLNSRRRSYSLDNLSKDYLNKNKIELKSVLPIHQIPASAVSVYAMHDASLHLELGKELQLRCSREELTKVLDLEDDLIYCTASMMRNGALIDVGKLESWKLEINTRLIHLHLKLANLVGFACDPNSPKHLIRLFDKYKLEYDMTEKGNPSFTGESLKKIEGNEAVQIALEILQLSSLKDKYIIPYLELVDSNGILRYYLHQLRSDEYGTVSGRYSSSGGKKGTKGLRGINVQQVFKPSAQLENFTRDFIVRSLFVPPKGEFWISADASQIEFRLFGHYSQDNTIVGAFKKNPWTDFHQIVADLVGQERKDAKHTNFGVLYGMGKNKLARKLGRSVEDAEPLLAEYHRKFPAARRLSSKASKLAETRGFVKTLLGRRRRFGVQHLDTKYHAALNSVISGTAADINKTHLLNLYRNRKDLGFTMRFTVHDEADGNIPNMECAKKINAILREQLFGLSVPILWNVEVGKNWYDTKSLCGKGLPFGCGVKKCECKVA